LARPTPDAAPYFPDATVTLSFAAFTRTVGRVSSPIYSRQFFTSLPSHLSYPGKRDQNLFPKKLKSRQNSWKTHYKGWGGKHLGQGIEKWGMGVSQ